MSLLKILTYLPVVKSKLVNRILDGNDVNATNFLLESKNRLLSCVLKAEIGPASTRLLYIDKVFGF